jgi:hypothetical protein
MFPRADLVDATLALSTPRFNLSTSNLHPDIKEADTSALMYPEISISCTCVEQLQYIFHELRSITFSVTVEENITSVISDRIYVAERQLLLLAKSLKDAPHIHSSSCVAISNSIVQAALIYLVSSLRDCPLIAPLFGRYLGRLCDHIWKHNPLAVWEGKYSMLLWTVVMGVMVADGAPERARLVRLAAYVCCIQSINSQDDLLACVKDILWRDGSRFGLQKLWSDIEYIMLKELIYLDIWADQFIGVFL